MRLRPTFDLKGRPAYLFHEETGALCKANGERKSIEKSIRKMAGVQHPSMMKKEQTILMETPEGRIVLDDRHPDDNRSGTRGPYLQNNAFQTWEPRPAIIMLILVRSCICFLEL